MAMPHGHTADMTAEQPRGPSSRTAALESRRRDPVFLSQTSAIVLVDAAFVIRAATPTYAAVTQRDEEELITVGLFEAFPDNPECPEDQPTRTLAASIEQAMRTRQSQYLPPMRYDIADPKRPGKFVEKRWLIVSSPVTAGDEVIGASVRGHDLTLAEESLVESLAQYREVLAQGDLRAQASRRRLETMDAFLELVDSHGRLSAEVASLREALHTRGTIGQAMGLIMADRRCSPEEAFEVLKRLSMNTNVRVADVAAALVYQSGPR